MAYTFSKMRPRNLVRKSAEEQLVFKQIAVRRIVFLMKLEVK